MVATSSIGPGATNMVTAAAAALANRLPLLLLCGDTFQSRVPDPVLQQVEHFGVALDDGQRRLPRRDALLGPDRLARRRSCRACRSRSRRCSTRPTAGPAFLGLPQDVQAEAYDYPARSVRAARARAAAAAPRPARARRGDSAPPRGAAARADRGRRRPLLARRGRAPRVRRAARGAGGRDDGGQGLPDGRPSVLGRPGRRHRVRPRQPRRRRGRCRPGGGDAPAGLHDRLVDRVRRGDPDRRRSTRRGSTRRSTSRLPLVGDARECLAELGEALGDWRAGEEWTARAQ